MKRIAVTQRVDIIQSVNERRDAIDQRWTDFLMTCGLLPVFIPNHVGFTRQFLRYEKIDGFLLTGGNSLTNYGGDAPERDEMEKILLDYAIAHKLPVLGVCRGMQVIQDYFGVKLSVVSNHVATRHTLKVSAESRYREWLDSVETVNAFHNFGTYDSSPQLFVSARAADDVVMAVEHINHPIFGQMWHSERETPFVDQEIALFQNFYQGKTQ